jgi:hypothetical protein
MNTGYSGGGFGAFGSGPQGDYQAYKQSGGGNGRPPGGSGCLSALAVFAGILFVLILIFH